MRHLSNEVCRRTRLRYRLLRADYGLEAHADHIIVGVCALHEFGVLRWIEHAAFGDHRDFDGAKVIGAKSDGIRAIRQIADWHQVAADRQALDGVWNTAICGDKLDERAGAGFTVLCKLHGVLVGVANADVEDAGGLLGGLGAEVNKETTDDGGECDEADDDILAGCTFSFIRFFCASHVGSYGRERAGEKPEFAIYAVRAKF